jgi:hypothetical protein
MHREGVCRIWADFNPLHDASRVNICVYIRRIEEEFDTDIGNIICLSLSRRSPYYRGTILDVYNPLVLSLVVVAFGEVSSSSDDLGSRTYQCVCLICVGQSPVCQRIRDTGEGWICNRVIRRARKLMSILLQYLRLWQKSDVLRWYWWWKRSWPNHKVPAIVVF